ncbi:MAG TPA: FxsA family protein [Longimicrobiales bacterium]|nr:FxsA family protein [Longimicrobiales bacterium]
MSCFARLAFFFVVIPVLEVVLLVRIGQAVGFLPTLAVVLGTGIVGAALARAEGLRILFQARQELMMGRIPGQALLDGISVLVAGAFLLAPGILTDIAGIALLVPPSRRWIQRKVRARLEAGAGGGAMRFVVLDPSGRGVPFGGPPEGRAPERQADQPTHEPGLDPRHEIRIETRDP